MVPEGARGEPPGDEMMPTLHGHAGSDSAVLHAVLGRTDGVWSSLSDPQPVSSQLGAKHTVYSLFF